jgi:hypothetical protein
MIIKSNSATDAYLEMLIQKEAGQTDFKVSLPKNQEKRFEDNVRTLNGFYLNGYFDGMIRVGYIKR